MEKCYFCHFRLGLFVSSLFLMVTSSRSEVPPPYNRTDAIFITEFFHALELQDYPLALRKLERMNELEPGSVVFFDLIRELKENMIIESL